MWFGLARPLTSTGPAALRWFLVGNLLYYLTAIGLACLLRDNRAFCKYLCPVVVPLKLGARFSLLKVRGDRAQCTGCGACGRACPQQTLRLTWALDVGGAALLRERPAPYDAPGVPTQPL